MLELRAAVAPMPRPLPGAFTAWERVRACDGASGCGDLVATRVLAGGRLAAVAVDVIGSGRGRAVRSAAIAAHVLALLTVGARPSAAVRLVDRELQRGGWLEDLPPLAALFAGVADRWSGTLTYASAAIETALVVDRAGAARMLPATGPIGGVFADAAFDERDVPFAAGEVLVVATDGVTDSHPRDVAAPFFGSARAAGSVTRALVHGEDPARALVDEATRYAGARPDDAAAIVVRHERR